VDESAHQISECVCFITAGPINAEFRFSQLMYEFRFSQRMYPIEIWVLVGPPQTHTFAVGHWNGIRCGNTHRELSRAVPTVLAWPGARQLARHPAGARGARQKRLHSDPSAGDAELTILS
jgi:hypothetical protein